MSYGITPIKTNIKRIEQQILNLSEEHKKEYIEELKDLADSFSDPVIQIITDMLNGKDFDPQYAYLYWYIFERIFLIHGSSLNNSEWYPTNLTEICELKELKAFDLQIENIPTPDDFPIVLSCRSENLEKLRTEVNEHISDSSQKDQFLSWIDSCSYGNSNDLVLYYY
ncbi:DUF7691 family protein [Flammeovirga pacifica]|uniref:DUF7691 domain-containing protein n=1 Tax=Flammeovirga pacifica TaxID=915059 RepID=A0A1S1YX43_FLAPC|nr:hypothetical protein [Flammeovirga pacifica]OHX65405.1 hypothetical protein NH26_03100 [Flammeovirga pacifica]